MNGQQRQMAGGQNGRGRSGQSQLAVAPNGVATQPQDSAIEKKEDGGSEVAQQNVFDQPIILKQPSYWSRAIMITIMSVTVLAVLAAIIGKVEEAVPATGKLEPEGEVQEVQAPSSGVVEEILVKDGDQVEKDQTLIKLDPKVSEAELISLMEIRKSTAFENDFYSKEIHGTPFINESDFVQVRAEIPPYYEQLTLELRALKERENVFQQYMQYLSAPEPPTFFTNVPLQELADAVWKQLEQVNQQIRGTNAQIREINQRLAIEAERVEISTVSEGIERDILGSVEPLVEEGALARIQLQRQQSELLARQNELGARYSELQSLEQQKAALGSELSVAQQQQQSIVATARADARNQLNTIVDRQKQIISDINNRIIANNNRITELSAQIAQAETQLTYQVIRSPIDGVVFDVQPQVQGLVNPNSAEPVMKVVPSDALVANVFLSNQDVGFVLKAMEEKSADGEFVPVDVRIDSFPFSEFGDVEGRVTWIGDDALPPDQIRQFFHFPATIELDQQYITVDGAPVQLQSGMSVSVNVKTRKRRIITLFTDLFQRRVEKLRER